MAVTTSTVGFGDISPVTSLECFFIIFVLLSSGIIYAYSINEIGTIMNNIKVI